MNIKHLMLAAVLAAPLWGVAANYDPPCVVEQWTNSSTYPKVIDINFSETTWPDTWAGETGRDCPSMSDGGYVNAILDTPTGVTKYPVLFHNCTFATNASANGFGGATAAFSRQYYLGEKASGNSTTSMNNWTVTGHTVYLEDNIERNAAGVPTHGEAGFVQMCRDAAVNGVSQHGWMEIDHIPYVDRLQWSWSSTSWGRGIKLDIKVGDGEWTPLVWMGSDKQKVGWTVFSDQGYFIENEIKASDVSLRWRVWDGQDADHLVQTNADGTNPFNNGINPNAMCQAPRVHKIQIFGNEITAAQADYARQNPVGDVGELSDLSQFGFTGGGEQTAPDVTAPVVVYRVNKQGTADYTTIQAAIDAVAEGTRGIIYIEPGTYSENLYAGRKGEKAKYISLIGAGRAQTILTSNVSRGDGSKTFNDCAALNVYSPFFYAENLTIANTSGDNGQAEALYTSGDGHIFNNVAIKGRQDTYKSNVGSRGYFNSCLVEGTVDFIYDSGLEWFEGCEIKSVGNGYVTAPGTSPMPMTQVMYPELSTPTFYPGIFFRDCELTSDNLSAGSCTLGRPWGENAGAAYLNCTIGSHISAAGWTAWSGNESSASFIEYKNVDSKGSPVNTSARASFSRQATDAEVSAYLNPEFLFANYSKVPFDFKGRLESAAAPANFLVEGDITTWDRAELDAAYIIYDAAGAVITITTEPMYTGSDIAAVSSISRYGVTSAKVPVTDAKPRLKAFPTADGFGKYTTGGRGGEVVTVTSLADDGSEGTLRWAFNQHKGKPLTVVFAVSGDIALQSELRINRADWTLAGQTAPGDGIVITRNKVNLGGSQNFIVRNMRFRVGQKNAEGQILTENALGAENCADFIFDHCSFGWSVEENMNTADAHFLTVQYSIVHEGLYNAGHSKGARGYGCQWGGSPATYHHNLLAHNNSRSCRFNGARGEDHVVFMEYINNVNYNYGSNGGCYGGENTAPVATYNGLNSAHECNFIGNYYRPGANSNTSKVVFVNSSYARDGATSWAPAKWYVSGNVAHGFDAITADNWKGMTAETYSLSQIRADERIVPQNAYYKYALTGVEGRYYPGLYMMTDIEDATAAYQTVCATAGTINRDKVESRVAREALGGTTTYGGATKGSGKGIIDTENDAEGFFAYSTNYTVPADTDGDGMPDAWETAHKLDPNTADQNTLNDDGYTALEVYLNSLMGEDMGSNFNSDIVTTEIITPTVTYDSDSKSVIVGNDATGAILAVYDLRGAIHALIPVKGPSVSLASLATGYYIVRLEGNGIAPRSLKVAVK